MGLKTTAWPPEVSFNLPPSASPGAARERNVLAFEWNHQAGDGGRQVEAHFRGPRCRLQSRVRMQRSRWEGPGQLDEVNSTYFLSQCKVITFFYYFSVLFIIINKCFFEIFIEN